MAKPKRKHVKQTAVAPRTKQAGLRVVGICLGFGLGLLVECYVLGVLLGGWLDQRFGTAPLCLVLGVLLALGLSFYTLFHALLLLDKAEKKEKSS